MMQKCIECEHINIPGTVCKKGRAQNTEDTVNLFKCEDYIAYCYLCSNKDEEDVCKQCLNSNMFETKIKSDNNYQQHKKICEKLNEIYINKNIAYGNSFSNSVKELGILAAVTRLYDKMERVKALTKGAKNNVKDERLEDTLMDLANYAIMTYMEVVEDDTTSN